MKSEVNLRILGKVLKWKNYINLKIRKIKKISKNIENFIKNYKQFQENFMEYLMNT